jgi:hypothetical protein
LLVPRQIETKTPTFMVIAASISKYDVITFAPYSTGRVAPLNNRATDTAKRLGIDLRAACQGGLECGSRELAVPRGEDEELRDELHSHEIVSGMLGRAYWSSTDASDVLYIVLYRIRVVCLYR